jgi:hypothetical protein
MDEATKQQYHHEVTEIFQRTQAALVEAEKRIHAQGEAEVLALRQKFGLPFYQSPDEL